MPGISKRPACVSALGYKDPMAAFNWLQKAFDFEPAMLITDADGNFAHAEMVYGDGWIMVGSEWTDDHRSPANIGRRHGDWCRTMLARLVALAG